MGLVTSTLTQVNEMSIPADLPRWPTWLGYASNEHQMNYLTWLEHAAYAVRRNQTTVTLERWVPERDDIKAGDDARFFYQLLRDEWFNTIAEADARAEAFRQQLLVTVCMEIL